MTDVDHAALSPDRVQRLRSADLTYMSRGGTRTGEVPDGYTELSRSRLVGTGQARFDQVARALLAWDMHRRAGLGVRASPDVVVPGAVAVLRLGVGPLAISAPVRVVYLVDEPRRQGFAYGTLPGHPESGEEAFVLELHEDESIVFAITAFSRPATWPARAAGPVGRHIQSRVTERYLRSVGDLRAEGTSSG